MPDSDYSPEPRTQEQYLSALWIKVLIIEKAVNTTNGRVNRLERFMWSIGGGLVVIAAIIVPQWLGLLHP